jgi:hypothetical protein
VYCTYILLQCILKCTVLNFENVRKNVESTVPHKVYCTFYQYLRFVRTFIHSYKIAGKRLGADRRKGYGMNEYINRCPVLNPVLGQKIQPETIFIEDVIPPS